MHKKITLLISISSIIFLTGCSIGKYEGSTAKEWAERADSLEDRLYDYAAALDEANNNIENAQIYTSGSYEDMEYALSNLSTVSEPY